MHTWFGVIIARWKEAASSAREAPGEEKKEEKLSADRALKHENSFWVGVKWSLGRREAHHLSMWLLSDAF